MVNRASRRQPPATVLPSQLRDAPRSIEKPNVRIYILCHDDKRLAEAKDMFGHYYWAVPIRMKYQDATFENAFWRQLLEIENEWKTCEMVGTLSSKAFKKVKLGDVDRIIRSRSTWNSGFYHFVDTDVPLADTSHPHLMTIINDIVAQLDLPHPTANFYNYWMCTPEKMRAFIQWFESTLKPAVLAHPLSMEDAKYPGALTAQQCQTMCGVPYYPHVPFVLERMNKVFFSLPEIVGKRIYIIGGVDAGGSNKFVNDLKRINTNIIHITNCTILKSIEFHIDDVVFIEHLFQTDITVQDITSIINQCVTVINIHDFTWFNRYNAHDSYILNIHLPTPIKNFLESVSLVVHPSKFTFDIYAKYCDTRNFIYSPHCDYMVPSTISSYVPPITSYTINVGVLHDYSECKGKEVIEHFREKYKVYKGYTIQYCIPNHTIPLYNELEFFEFVKKYNIHGLTLLNKWGETYCYTLTKYLMTGLPIVYSNIGAPRERIPSAENMFLAINDEEEYSKDSPIIEKAFVAFLDYIIAHAGKGVCVTPEITWNIPPLYKRLLDKSKPMTDIVLINSAICTSTTALSYAKNRSIYSHEQRFAQTLETIASIYKFLPDAFIMMIDNTNLPKLWKSVLNTLIDKTFFLYNDPVQAELTNKFPYKGVAESHQLLHMLRYIDENPEFSVVKNIYKITGRYSLTDSFSVMSFDNSDIVFKQIEPTSPLFEKEPACYTSFFKVPYLLRDEFRQSLLRMIDKGSTGKSMECIVPYEFTSTVHLIDTLGIRGMIGPFGIECKA